MSGLESLHFASFGIAALTGSVVASWLAQISLDVLQRRFLVSQSEHLPSSSLAQAYERARRQLVRRAMDHGLVLVLIPTGLLTDWIRLWQTLPVEPGTAAAGALATGVGMVHALRAGVSTGRPSAAWPDTVAGATIIVALLALLAVVHGSFLAAWAVWGAALIIWHCVLSGPLLARGSVVCDAAHDEDGALQRLMRQVGQPAHRLRVRPAHSAGEPPNAGAAGMGPATRVVLHENLLHALPRQATAAVIAHELGHVLRYHRLIYYGLAAVAALPLFAALHAGVSDSRGSVTVAAYVFVLASAYLALPLASDWVAPVANAIRRRMEMDADYQAAALTSPKALAQALRTLEQLRGADGQLWHPLVSWFRVPYPSLSTRCRALQGLRSG